MQHDTVGDSGLHCCVLCYTNLYVWHLLSAIIVSSSPPPFFNIFYFPSHFAKCKGCRFQFDTDTVIYHTCIIHWNRKENKWKESREEKWSRGRHWLRLYMKTTVLFKLFAFILTQYQAGGFCGELKVPFSAFALLVWTLFLACSCPYMTDLKWWRRLMFLDALKFNYKIFINGDTKRRPVQVGLTTVENVQIFPFAGFCYSFDCCERERSFWAETHSAILRIYFA